MLTYTQRATGGTASASAENAPGEAAGKAFDESNSSKWLAPSATSPTIQYRFGSSNQYVITCYVITSANDSSGRDPKTWTFEGSNNGSSWTTLDTRTNQTFANRQTERVFQFANTTAYEYYRLNISANNGDGDTQIEEIGLFTQDNISTEVAYGGAATSRNEANTGDGEKPTKAFDKSFSGGSTKWNDQKLSGNFWLQYDFGELTTHKIFSYTIVTANDATERDPKIWTLQASNTGSFGGEEVTVDTVADGLLSNTRGDSKTFTCANQPAIGYRFYRLVVSDLKDLASANSIQIAELQLNAIDSDIKKAIGTAQANIKKVFPTALAAFKKLSGVTNI